MSGSLKVFVLVGLCLVTGCREQLNYTDKSGKTEVILLDNDTARIYFSLTEFNNQPVLGIVFSTDTATDFALTGLSISMNGKKLTGPITLFNFSSSASSVIPQFDSLAFKHDGHPFKLTYKIDSPPKPNNEISISLRYLANGTSHTLTRDIILKRNTSLRFALH